MFFCGKQQIQQQTVNSAAKHENVGAQEYCWLCSGLAIIMHTSII